MMHDELHPILPDAVYSALDSNSHLPADKRFKLQEACKKSNTSALFDPAVGAPFGHQLQLSLAEGAHFDPVKRGLALAIAGRSAGVESATASSLLEATGRRALLLDFRNDWSSIEADKARRPVASRREEAVADSTPAERPAMASARPRLTGSK